MKLQREMSITHSDFLRLLPRLLVDFNIETRGNTITAYRHDVTIRITLGDERQRRIASLTLPVTDIRIELAGFTEAGAQAFLQRFENTYRRGGG